MRALRCDLSRDDFRPMVGTQQAEGTRRRQVSTDGRWQEQDAQFRSRVGGGPAVRMGAWERYDLRRWVLCDTDGVRLATVDAEVSEHRTADWSWWLTAVERAPHAPGSRSGGSPSYAHACAAAEGAVLRERPELDRRTPPMPRYGRWLRDPVEALHLYEVVPQAGPRTTLWVAEVRPPQEGDREWHEARAAVQAGTPMRRWLVQGHLGAGSHPAESGLASSEEKACERAEAVLGMRGWVRATPANG